MKTERLEASISFKLIDSCEDYAVVEVTIPKIYHAFFAVDYTSRQGKGVILGEFSHAEDAKEWIKVGGYR